MSSFSGSRTAASVPSGQRLSVSRSMPNAGYHGTRYRSDAPRCASYFCGGQNCWVNNCVKYGAWVTKMRVEEEPAGIGLLKMYEEMWRGCRGTDVV